MSESKESKPVGGFEIEDNSVTQSPAARYILVAQEAELFKRGRE
jgi:hypothetical protein